MKEKRCGIYVLDHIETGRLYVGQSIDIDRRLREHAKGATGDGILWRAIAKHGWPTFASKVLELCCHDELNATEQKWVAELGSMHPAGFNLTTGGAQYKFTDEARRIISERTRAVMTKEWIAKRAEKQRGIPKSAEWKAKMSLRQSQPDNIDRLRKMARNQSPETRAKIGSGNKGKVRTPEMKAKISAGKNGAKHRPSPMATQR